MIHGRGGEVELAVVEGLEVGRKHHQRNPISNSKVGTRRASEYLPWVRWRPRYKHRLKPR